MTLKEHLYLKCKDFISQRKSVINEVISEIEISLQSETKSSAGDKHETGRAMLQLEREKSGVQLSQIGRIEEVLSKINITKNVNNVSLGSIVYTSQNNYFIGISAGELQIGNEVFYAISSSTPIGKLLIGKKMGDEVIFKNTKLNILKIV